MVLVLLELLLVPGGLLLLAELFLQMSADVRPGLELSELWLSDLHVDVLSPMIEMA